MLNIWFQIMHCCIPTPTSDSNISTGMIWVTLNMPSATEQCHKPSGSFTLESGHPFHRCPRCHLGIYLGLTHLSCTLWLQSWMHVSGWLCHVQHHTEHWCWYWMNITLCCWMSVYRHLLYNGCTEAVVFYLFSIINIRVIL